MCSSVKMMKKTDRMSSTIRITAVASSLMLLSFWPALAADEHLDVTVELFTELLPSEKQERLADLGRRMEDYFREYEWIEEFSGPPIPFTFRMYLVDESVGFEDRYGARIHASNEYDVQYLDKDCHFAYRPDDRLEHDAIRYHPLTGLMDFYADMIIGSEMDKRSTMGGTPYFKKAHDVVQEALFSEFFRGWNQRSEEVGRALAEENVPYRKMLAVYFRALDLWENDMSEKAYSFCLSALAMIDEILEEKPDQSSPSRYQREQIERFFTHHYREIAKLLSEAPDSQGAFELLMALDPQHSDFYQDYLKN